jgi:hypothetical protein
LEQGGKMTNPPPNSFMIQMGQYRERVLVRSDSLSVQLIGYWLMTGRIEKGEYCRAT